MGELTTDMILVLIVLGVTVFLFVSEWLRVDVVAICIMVALPLMGLVTPAEAFSGLSSNAVVSIIAVIIIGAGLDRTGVVNGMVGPVLKIAGESKTRVIIAISITVALISSFMQNIGAAALFLPAIQRVSKKMGIPLSEMLMPIGFSAILGGTLTLVGCSPLILLNDLMEPFDLESFNLFDVTPIGAALVGTGIASFIFLGRFILPQPKAAAAQRQPDSGDESSDDQTDHQAWELRTPQDYTHYREPVRIEDIKERYLVTVTALLEPPDYKIVSPPMKTELHSNVDLVVHGREEDVRRMAEAEGLELKAQLEVFAEEVGNQAAGSVEAVVAPRSHYIGQTLEEAEFEERLGVKVLAIQRHREVLRSDIARVPLRAGDVMELHGTWRRLHLLQRDRQLLFTLPTDFEEIRSDKALLAAFWLAVSLTMIMAFKVQLSVSLMTGALGMVVTRVLSIDEAYRSVDWRTVFLLAGLIPLGLATQSTGTAEWIATQILLGVGDAAPIVLVFVIGALATFFTLVISNVGATVLLVPLAVNMAMKAGLDPRMAALAVGLATSNSFMLPTHQVNALYMGPGGYRSKDFLKAGSLVSVLFLVVMVGMMSIVFGI